MKRRSTFMTGMVLLTVLSLASCSAGAITENSSTSSSSFSSEPSEDVVKHTIRFYLDGELVKTINVKDGSKMNAPSSEELPKGYIIDHWYVLEGGLKSPWSFSGGIVTSDLNLYADFSYETYIVALVSPDGSDTYKASVSYKQAYDFSDFYHQYRYADHLENEEGASFAVSGMWLSTHGETLTPIFHARTIAYEFYEIISHDYELNDREPIQNVSNPNPTSVLGKPSDLDTSLKDATKDGYRFEGWFDISRQSDDAKFLRLDNLYDAYFGSRVCGLFTKLYSISVVSEDETKGRADFADWKMSSASVLDEITVKAIPTEGCVLKGWYDGETRVVTDNPYTFTMPLKNLTLEARFMTKAEETEYRKALGAEPVIDSASNTLTYGLYPQSRVSDSAILASLNALESAESNGWYLLNDEYYAKKETDFYDSGFEGVFNDGAKIISVTTYWFKCEPIKWRVLDSFGNSYSLISSVLLDARRFDDSSNCYPDSEIREWLAGDFYEKAFSFDDSFIHAIQHLACGWNWTDKICLYRPGNDGDRRCKTTEWARANEAYHSKDSAYFYNGQYWTGCSYGADGASFTETISEDGGYASTNVFWWACCVRPAITIGVA